MLKENIIEPSQSPWSSPVCLVLKKDGDYRFCVDYRKLNSVTKPDAYPLLYISSILDQLRDCHYMSSIDIKSAFWQVDVAPDSREYTAFTVPGRGLYQFRRMPFGLINSPAGRFIPNFASIIAPLTKLTRKNVTFAWTEECSSAFTKLKEVLISAPLLSAPDFSRLFTLQCDASSFGLGAVLTQTFDDGERPICYLSRSLTRTERNLSTTEKECLCVIWAVEKLRHYLEGTRFVVITDHHSLLWLHRLKDPQGRLARWALRLQPYDFEIKHRPGKDHVVPDMLSRSVPIMCFTDATKHFSDTNDAWYKRMRESIVSDPLKYPQFRVENNVLFK
jgi:hypothetical protein